jgi:hypothetical protein
VDFSFLFARPTEGFENEARLSLAQGHCDSGLDGIVAARLRIDHQSIGGWVSAKMVAQKNSQLPALKSGNAGSCILHRISGVDPRNFQGFCARFFP